MLASRNDLFSPKKYKSTRIHKNLPVGVTSKRKEFQRGFSGIFSIGYGTLTWRRIETGRRFITRQHRRGKVWRKVGLTQPITAKNSKSRIGKGKGKFKAWVGYIRPGTLIYEAELPVEAVFEETRNKQIRASRELPLQKINQKFPFKIKVVQKNFIYKETIKWRNSSFLDKKVNKSFAFIGNKFPINFIYARRTTSTIFFWQLGKCITSWIYKIKINFSEFIQYAKFYGHHNWQKTSFKKIFGSSTESKTNMDIILTVIFRALSQKIILLKHIKRFFKKKRKKKAVYSKISIRRLCLKKIKNQKIKQFYFFKKIPSLVIINAKKKKFNIENKYYEIIKNDQIIFQNFKKKPSPILFVIKSNLSWKN